MTRLTIHAKFKARNMPQWAVTDNESTDSFLELGVCRAR